MEHFLVTRFNLTVPDWKTSKNGGLVLTDEWLKKRFYLFENYCLPSVRNQINQNFVWCVFFDTSTSEYFRDKIKIIEANYKNFKPIFIDGMGYLKDSFIDFISHNISKDEEDYIITTRLDNDDIVHKDFVNTIQSLFQPIDLTVIDLKKGYQVSIDIEKPEVRLYTHPFNAFISIIESSKSFNTVFSRAHYGWKNENYIVSFVDKRLWIELSHHDNYVNHRMTSLKKAYSFNKKDFSLSDEFDFKIDFNDAVITNFEIEFIKFIKFVKQKNNFFIKLPKRARRYLLKKYKIYIK